MSSISPHPKTASHWSVTPPDHKLARNWASPGARAPISKFLDPLNISQTGKATIFKFGTHIGRGQFLPRTTNWPEIGLRSAGAGAYCGGHLAAQLVVSGCFTTVYCVACLSTDVVRLSSDKCGSLSSE